MLNVWDEARPDELDTEADVNTRCWRGFAPILFMNGSDAGGDEPDQHFDGRVGELHCGNRDWGDGGAQSVCHGLSGDGNVK